MTSLRLRDGPRGPSGRSSRRRRNHEDRGGGDDEGEVVDGLFESLQQDTGRSDADSTDLSSLLPIVTPSQVRANAPRASLPTPKDVDEYTVETNRPIDSVYIYPTAATAARQATANHRQRRNYRSGLRSGASSGSSSIGGLSNGSVGGILETLGLGSGETTHNEVEDTSTHKSSQASSRESFVRPMPRRGRPMRRGASGAHSRAAFVLFLLMSVLYGAFQWIAMVKTNRSVQASKAKSKKKHRAYYRAFEEGEDRPVDKELWGKIAGGGGSSSSINKPKKTEPEENTPSELYEPKGKEDKRTQETAPADSLDKITKKADDSEKSSFSLAVESGLAGVYSKDSHKKDIPFLWYIPRSGGGMIKNILSNCKDLVVASEVGATVKKAGEDPNLGVVTVAGHQFVNVDTTTLKGIAEAKAMGLASSGLAQLVVSPRFQEGASLFHLSHKGRVFSVFRHPVERAVSMFYFLKKHNVAAVSKMELEEYCKSPHVENNWMTRILTDRMSGDVTEAELEIAKATLKEKVVVGLLEQKEESMRRFEHYFGWRYTESKQTACRTRILVGDYRTNESARGRVKEGSQAWSLLLWQNKLDMKLYKYAKALFLQQGAELFADMD